MNSVEELVVRIQNGEEELMHDLWNEVEGFVRWTAKRFAPQYVQRAFASSKDEAFEDIFNGCGYPALVAAIRKYDRERGQFTTILYECIRNEIRAFYGIRGTKRDAILAAISLNEIMPGSDDQEFIDLLLDDADGIEETEDSILREQRRKMLDAVIDSLPETEAAVIWKKYYERETIHEIAEDMGCTGQSIYYIERRALRRIRNGKFRRQLWDYLYPGVEYSLGLKRTSFRTYKQTGERATEEAALSIIALKEKTAKNLPVDQSILDVYEIMKNYENW